MGATTLKIKKNSDKVEYKEQRSFVNWVNWILKDENITIKTLTRDLQDGLVLIHLAQKLLNKELKFIQNPKLSAHKYGRKKKNFKKKI